MATPRSSATDLIKLFSRTAAGIYVLDDRRRIVFLNDLCRAWIGDGADGLLGLECRYHSTPDDQGQIPWTAVLCPPPEVLRGHRATSTLTLPQADGHPVVRSVEFMPLPGSADDSFAVLAVVSPEALPVEVSTGDAALSGLSEEPTAHQLHAHLLRYRGWQRERYHTNHLVGDSSAMKRVRSQVSMAAASAASVVVAGPTGSGRQHVAKTIHFAHGAATAGPLVPLACSLLDAELLQATIRALAKPKPATGAPRLETLLLNDVDQMPSAAQAELLGLMRIVDLPIRIISTARHPLLELTAQGEFRPELASLLSTLTIELPPLAERMEDLPLLAQYFLEELNAQGTKQLGGFAPEALDRLAGYPWPGQLDELAGFVRLAYARAEGPQVTAQDLPPRVQLAADATRHAKKPLETIVLETFLADIERELIERALARAKGNKTKAARLLGMTRPRLYRRLVQLGLEKEPT